MQNSACYIDENRNPTGKPSPKLTEDAEHRPGNWLFGGRYDLRFGHFLVESVARLWALDYIDVPISGVVYMPGRPLKAFNPKRLVSRGRALYDLFDGLPSPEIISKPTRFETLFIPPQGCGAGELAVGCPEFRYFARKRFTKRVAPNGDDKLYISRSAMLSSPGQIVHEKLLETQLERDGFSIIHPQNHSIDEQIARISAAQIIVGVEGSAFHLVAYAANQNCKIGVIRRRDKNHGIINHCRAFHGARAIDLDAFEYGFVAPGSKHAIGNAVLDFVSLSRQLRFHGLVGLDFDLPTLSEVDVAEGVEELQRKILS
ncbi:glycosyltransferase 61 family protein [Pacificibacter sp.]|uniref:glycosyltransferase family 61 protein n=1 Tax=Pacificibacter sp. TaxID=1917866 RepID=UPI00321C2DCA